MQSLQYSFWPEVFYFIFSGDYFVYVLYVKCNLNDIEKKKNIMERGVYLKDILSLGNTFLGNLKVT